MGLTVGQADYFRGFFTRALHLRGKPAIELEDILGFERGRLGQGWWLLFMLELPGPHDFEFRGYTQMSGGIEQGHLASPPDRRTAEERVKDLGHSDASMAAFKRRFVADNFVLHGPYRLAKLLPKAGGAGYPPGRGIPQWELTAKRRFLVAAEVGPGAMYLGNYQ